MHQFQKLLLENKQIITYFEDIGIDDKAFAAAQFWGTKGFFSSYRTEIRDFMKPDDLNNWLNIFSDLSGIRTKNVAQTNGLVSVSDFIAILFEIGLKNNLCKADVPYEVSLTATGLGPDEWLYNSREHSLPVIRGEACLALYILFFQLLDNRD
jgi:hypothetical protein